MNIKKVLVIGAGQMGHGIAQVCVTGGAEVKLFDASEEAAQQGHDKILAAVNRGVEKGRFTEVDFKDIASRLSLVKSYEEAADVDMVIEAAPENIDIKRKIATDLDALMPEHVILATTTSALPITDVMNQTKHPERTIGTHFHHPPAVMKLVEVVNGFSTSQKTSETMIKFLAEVGKAPVPCKDYPGFVSSRVGIIMLNEGIHTLADGVSSPEDIDAACRYGFNWPMGPLELSDLIGLETILMILDDLTFKLGERFRPSPLLRQMVSAGHLGVKTGKGFYDHTKKG